MEPIKSGRFTFSVPGGFLNCGVPRADKKTLTRYLNPVRPLRKHQNWSPPKLTGKWCKAQLAHYGIKPLMGSKSELEARLRDAERDGLLRKQPAEMKLLEKYMTKEWKAKNDDEKKVVKSEHQDDYGDNNGVCTKIDTVIKEEMMTIDSDYCGERTSKVKEERKFKAAGTKKITTTFSKKNILGTWNVSCPDIQVERTCTENLTMILFQDVESSSIVGKFIFGVMEGVLRLKINPSTKNPVVGFYWAGTVGEGGEIQLREREGEMKFYNRGEMVRGCFQCIKGVGKDIEFEAVKAGSIPIKGRVNFEKYAKEVYESNITGRWR